MLERIRMFHLQLSETLMSAFFIPFVGFCENRFQLNMLRVAISCYYLHIAGFLAFATSNLWDLPLIISLIRQKPSLGSLLLTSDIITTLFLLLTAFRIYRDATRNIADCRKLLNQPPTCSRDAAPRRFNARLAQERTFSLFMLSFSIFFVTFLINRWTLIVYLASWIFAIFATHIHCCSSNPPPRQRKAFHSNFSPNPI